MEVFGNLAGAIFAALSPPLSAPPFHELFFIVVVVELVA